MNLNKLQYISERIDLHQYHPNDKFFFDGNPNDGLLDYYNIFMPDVYKTFFGLGGNLYFDALGIDRRAVDFGLLNKLTVRDLELKFTIPSKIGNLDFHFFISSSNDYYLYCIMSNDKYGIVIRNYTVTNNLNSKNLANFYFRYFSQFYSEYLKLTRYQNTFDDKEKKKKRPFS